MDALIPVGGTTGVDHEHSGAIDEAARWLAITPPHARPRPLVPALRELFGLSPAEACAAIRESHLIRARAQ